MQFNVNPTINPLRKLCREDKEIFRFVTECPRLRTHREEVFLDVIPQQDNWKISSIINLCICPTIYNLVSYQQVIEKKLFLPRKVETKTLNFVRPVTG